MGVPAVAMAATAIGCATAAYGKLMAGKEEARATQFDQAQFELQQGYAARKSATEFQQKELEFTTNEQNLGTQAKQYETAAAQSEALRREALTTSLEQIMAIRAERGVGDSPTGDAISNKMLHDALRDIQIEKVNYLTRADEARRAIALGRGQLALSEQQYAEETRTSASPA